MFMNSLVDALKDTARNFLKIISLLTVAYTIALPQQVALTKGLN